MIVEEVYTRNNMTEMDLHDNTLSFDYTVCRAHHYIHHEES